ncbi:hypothetical protein [Ferrovum sp. PN-J185]|uniref:hypothetical protein n=1 Tax=Ferrovum sp. PN-J185 TaxID=1356306 RepID=UPI00079C8C17|nr:hypothetical protein [Ferrovum sp. PN-J185]KXW55375.1 hypothetical protein FV185_16220 [Ferrovum sp. PN-J185]
MFGFGSKKQESAMDQFIKAIYGDPPPAKRANLSAAIDLAGELLMGEVSEKEISIIGTKLESGPIPYSTHDLALSIALNFFKDPQYLPKLGMAQMMARMTMLEWFQENKVAPLLVKSFEDTLYKLYK